MTWGPTGWGVGEGVGGKELVAVEVGSTGVGIGVGVEVGVEVRFNGMVGIMTTLVVKGVGVKVGGGVRVTALISALSLKNRMKSVVATK